MSWEGTMDYDLVAWKLSALMRDDDWEQEITLEHCWDWSWEIMFLKGHHWEQSLAAWTTLAGMREEGWVLLKDWVQT